MNDSHSSRPAKRQAGRAREKSIALLSFTVVLAVYVDNALMFCGGLAPLYKGCYSASFTGKGKGATLNSGRRFSH